MKQDVTIDFVMRLTDLIGFVNAVGGPAKIDDPPSWAEVPDDDADMDVEGTDEEIDAC